MASSEGAVLINLWVLVSAFSSFVKVLCRLCFLLSQSDITNVMHGTNTIGYLQLLCQAEWLQWGHNDWGHSAVCPDTLREVLLQCDLGYWRNEWHSVTSWSDLIYSDLSSWEIDCHIESGDSDVRWRTHCVWINGNQLPAHVWSVLQDIMGKGKLLNG